MNRTKIFALAFLAIFVLLGADASSCSGITADPGTGEGSGDLSPDEKADIATMQGADSNALAIAQATGAYAAYDLEVLIEQNGGDPSVVDDTTASQLMAQYGGQAWSAAVQWAQSVDPAAVPAANVVPKQECVADYGYKFMEKCDFMDGQPLVKCYVTACGTGKCGGCPDILNIGNLIVKNWAVHTCVRDSAIIGVRVTIRFQLVGEKFGCFLLDKPVQ
jgi:hypothetical protein